MHASPKSPKKITTLKTALLTSRRLRFWKWNAEDGIRFLFQGNAFISILILGLITLFLFREGLGFFPEYRRELELYRRAGLEFVEVIRQQSLAHSDLSKLLTKIRQQESQKDSVTDSKVLNDYIAKFRGIASPLNGFLAELTEKVVAIKEKYRLAQDAKEHQIQLQKSEKSAEAAEITVELPDFVQNAKELKAVLPRYHELNQILADEIDHWVSQAPTLHSPEAIELWKEFREKIIIYLGDMPRRENQLNQWEFNRPVPLWRGMLDFFTGKDWVTQSYWNDFYGILPLLIGSFLIAFLALFLAIPLGICSAIYVSQVASKREQKWIKPSIEFIAAIPSVVLGFFGIFVLGEGIRWLTQQEFLSWVPFFPIQERVNIFTAGTLLALMAIPTIFTLAEDALNNVPRSYQEASFALGATPLQTILKIMIPTALSGMMAAILLGFGRVIGETMVVLLVAGNRIAIPDFSEGLGVFFQPSHTMTGIIAQEMGEVTPGSVLYRALFMVGILLFLISLSVNYVAQHLVKRFKISVS